MSVNLLQHHPVYSLTVFFIKRHKAADASRPPDAASVVVRHHPCPHDVRPRFVVMRVRNDSRSFMDHRQQKRLDHPVCDLYFPAVGQITLVEVAMISVIPAAV